MIIMSPQISIPLLDAQACDTKTKNAELNCKGSTACGQPTASSLINSCNNSCDVDTENLCRLKFFHTENCFGINKGIDKESDQ